MAGATKGAAAAAAGSEAAQPKLNVLGEIRLPIGGQDYGLRPSRAAISVIEEQLRPLQSLVMSARYGELSLSEMGVIAAELMHAYGRAHPGDPLATDYAGAKPEKLADLIFEAGGPNIQGLLLVVLMGAWTGGYTASGEAKPAKTKTT